MAAHGFVTVDAVGGVGDHGHAGDIRSGRVLMQCGIPAERCPLVRSAERDERTVGRVLPLRVGKFLQERLC